MGLISDMEIECAKHEECTKKCDYYNKCISEFKAKKMNMTDNNPTVLQSEISGFEIYEDNCKENFTVNICEVPKSLIVKSIVSLYSFKEDIEIKNILRSALDKFYPIDNNDAEIKKVSENKYHFKFECTDCNATNEFEDYVNKDMIFFYCRYCGKKHQFNINKENEE